MATQANILIDQGSTFEISVNLFEGGSTIVDLSSYSVRGSIRKSYQASTKVDFDATLTPSASDGEITLRLEADVTAQMKPGIYIYDVELYDDGSPQIVKRVIEGIVEISASVTQNNPTGDGIGAEIPSSSSP